MIKSVSLDAKIRIFFTLFLRFDKKLKRKVNGDKGAPATDVNVNEDTNNNNIVESNI
jgi:hypothetical protein